MNFELKDDIHSLFPPSSFVSAFSFEEDSKFILNQDLEAFENWISQGAHAEMHFLEKNMEARRDANLILPGVKSALIFLFPYARGKFARGIDKGVDPAIKSRDDKAPSRDDKAPSRDDKAASQDDNSIISKKLISKYIYGKDYHTVLKKNLNEIGIILKNHLQEDFSYRPVTDSIPFFDRAHARKAGLGFVGKNTMVIRPGLGSFFFIATLLTTLPIEKLAKKAGKKNPIESLNCGACTKCLDACPTNALSKEYFLDANKCLSYLTIEHRNTVDEKYIPHFEKTIYGCDICQEVCPYNLVTSNFPLIKSFSERHKPFLFLTANMIASMTETQYEQWFGGTAATRAKYSGLVRNALYHLYAVSDPNLNDILASLENSKHSLIQKTTRQILSLLAKDIALT